MSSIRKIPRFFQVFAFLGGLLVIYFVFRSGQLDEWVTGLCYDADLDPVWFLDPQLWVKIAYRGGSLLTAAWGLAILVTYISGFWMKRLRRYRSLSVLCFLLLALGPGLFVNAVLKDNWGRPRPRETVAFGGASEYQAPFVMSDRGGKSFPCGHCSVGFSMCAFAFWNHRRPGQRVWAYFWWAVAFLLGGYLGLARIVVGAHYLSDVLVSGAVVFATAWALDAYIPATRCKHASLGEDGGAGDHSQQRAILSPVVLLICGAIGAFALVFVGLLAIPYHEEGVVHAERDSVGFADFNSEPRKALQIPVVTSDSSIFLEKGLSCSVGRDLADQFEWQAQGFGFPWSEVNVIGEFKEMAPGAGVVLLLSLDKKGSFSELNVDVHAKRRIQH